MKEIHLTGRLGPENLDATLLRLFQDMKYGLSEDEFLRITDPKIKSVEGAKHMKDNYGNIADVIENIYESLPGYSNGHLKAKNIGIGSALILVGGEATRLRPITYFLPKPLIPVNGKTLTEHVMDLANKHGIEDISLSVGYKKEMVKEYFGDKVTYTEEERPMGTAAPLYLMNRPDKPFLMINGDNLFDLDIKAMYKLFLEENALGVIALTPVDDSTRGGAVELNGNKVAGFHEKLSREQALEKLGSPPYWLNSGYYLLSPEIFDHLPAQKDITMMENDIFPSIAKTGRLHGLRSNGEWHDSGTVSRYENVIRNWKGYA
jgi:mannose-1-phosphate guanylyltransferase